MLPMGTRYLGRLQPEFLLGRQLLRFQVSFPGHQDSSLNGSTLKGENLLPCGASSFLLEKTSFLKSAKSILTKLSP